MCHGKCNSIILQYETSMTSIIYQIFECFVHAKVMFKKEVQKRSTLNDIMDIGAHLTTVDSLNWGGGGWPLRF